ncbi:MAG: tyrosine-type recombinase/integrase [Pleomorphochaeta sp.]
MKSGSQEITRVYLRGKSKNYYFQYSDSNGVRHQKSTKCKNKKDAIKVANSFIGNSNNFSNEALILKDWISLFIKPETNPRRKSALLNGSRYTDSYTKLNSRYAKLLLEVLNEKPAILSKPLDQFIRIDFQNIKELIITKKGYTRTSQLLFDFLKLTFTQAYQEGRLEYNPGANQPKINYKEKPKFAIPANILATIIKDKHVFQSIERWAFYTILATTGMRRGEILGMTPSRIKNNTLTIDRQWQRGKFTEPKMGFTRIIPLSKTTLYAISCLEEPETPDTRYFKKNSNWIDSTLAQIRIYGCAKFPEDEDIIKEMTCHILRHSFNTNLLNTGISPLLIAEYLSWKHQDLLRIQARYTHLVADNMKPVAEKVDELYSPNKIIKKNFFIL